MTTNVVNGEIARTTAGVRDGRGRRPCRDYGRDPRSRELAERIVARSRRLSALLREQLSDIAEFDAAEAWRGDGATSMVTWLADRCRVSTATARQWAAPAAKLASLPALSDALATGELSLDVVGPLAEVASPANEADLREASAHWSAHQVRELVQWHKATEEVLARSAVREYEHRKLRFNDAKRSMWVAFTRDDYATAKSALVGCVSREDVERRRAKHRTGPARSAGSEAFVPYDQRLYDALVGLFKSGGVHPEGAGIDVGRNDTRGLEPPGARTFRPRLIVHAPIEVLLGVGKGAGGGRDDAGDGVAEIDGVGPVSAEVVRRLACDADVVLSVEARSGSILDQRRARRMPTVSQRIEISRRDKGCRFPSCPFTEFTDIHHLDHWTHGGLTNLDNLITLCSRHHHAVHELGWAMSGDANGVVTFTSPQGNVMTSAPSPTWRPQSPPRGGKRRKGDGPLRR
jgi:hypothetical protein